jgi:hypothetical protein
MKTVSRRWWRPGTGEPSQSRVSPGRRGDASFRVLKRSKQTIGGFRVRQIPEHHHFLVIGIRSVVTFALNHAAQSEVSALMRCIGKPEIGVNRNAPYSCPALHRPEQKCAAVRDVIAFGFYGATMLECRHRHATGCVKDQRSTNKKHGAKNVVWKAVTNRVSASGIPTRKQVQPFSNGPCAQTNRKDPSRSKIPRLPQRRPCILRLAGPEDRFVRIEDILQGKVLVGHTIAPTILRPRSARRFRARRSMQAIRTATPIST